MGARGKGAAGGVGGGVGLGRPPLAAALTAPPRASLAAAAGGDGAWGGRRGGLAPPVDATPDLADAAALAAAIVAAAAPPANPPDDGAAAATGAACAAQAAPAWPGDAPSPRLGAALSAGAPPPLCAPAVAQCWSLQLPARAAVRRGLGVTLLRAGAAHCGEAPPLDAVAQATHWPPPGCYPGYSPPRCEDFRAGGTPAGWGQRPCPQRPPLQVSLSPTSTLYSVSRRGMRRGRSASYHPPRPTRAPPHAHTGTVAAFDRRRAKQGGGGGGEGGAGGLVVGPAVGGDTQRQWRPASPNRPVGPR